MPSQALSCPDTSSSCLTSPAVSLPHFLESKSFKQGQEPILDLTGIWLGEISSMFLEHSAWAQHLVLFPESPFRTLPRTRELGALWPEACHLIRMCRMPVNLSLGKYKAKPCVHGYVWSPCMREQSDGKKLINRHLLSGQKCALHQNRLWFLTLACISQGFLWGLVRMW